MRQHRIGSGQLKGRGALRFILAFLVLGGLLGREVEAAPAPGYRQAMAKKASGSPRLALRLSLRLGGGALRPFGKASSSKVRVLRRLVKVDRRSVEARAEGHKKAADALVRRAWADQGLSKRARGKLFAEAKKEYNRWETQVRMLVRARQIDSPVYKEWVRRTWEAKIVQLHAAAKHAHPDRDLARSFDKAPGDRGAQTMLRSLRRLSLGQYRQAIDSAWQGLYGGARDASQAKLLERNPLLMLPRSWGTSPRRRRETVSYTPEASLFAPKSWLRRKRYSVRKDIAFVWVPGVARTHTEFEKQQGALLESGILSLRAKTGSWKNPFRNAYDIAEQINAARRITKNPNVKIVLVGYSQGNNSSYAFMQAEGRNESERRLFTELRKNVVTVQDLDSAARGTPVADLGVVLTKIFTGRSQEVANIDRRLIELEQFLTIGSKTKQRAVVRWLQRNRLKVDGLLKSISGRKSKSPFSRLRARVADAIHDALVGGLESLTQARGKELMQNATIQRNLKTLPVINTIGVVPRSRKELLPTYGPLDQTAGWRFMAEALNLPNDYQVPAKLQALEPVHRGAVDLPHQAIGHWGITGVSVGRKTHNESHYAKFNPQLHTLTMLDMVRRMGL